MGAIPAGVGAIKAIEDAQRLLVGGRVERGAGGPHQQEGIEKRVVNRPLQRVGLAQAGGLAFGHAPSGAGFLKEQLRCAFELDLLPVDVDLRGRTGLAQREQVQVGGLDPIALARGVARGVHFGAIVVLLHRFDADPMSPVVARCVGQEANMIGRDAAAVSPLLEQLIKLPTHQRTDGVARLFRDEERRRRIVENAFLLHLRLDAQGRLELAARGRARRHGRNGGDLRIGIAVVTEQRKVEGVQRPVNDVFPDAECSRLMRRKARHFAAARVGARADLGSGEAIRIMQRHMPGSGAAEREAAQDDAIRIDLVAALHRGDSFININLASPVIGVVPTAVDIKRDLPQIGGLVLRAGRHGGEARDEVGFAQALIATVEPDVEAHGLGTIVGIGNRHAHRLHGAIKRGTMAVDPTALALEPRLAAGLQLARAFDALIEDAERLIDAFLSEECLRELVEEVPGF